MWAAFEHTSDNNEKQYQKVHQWHTFKRHKTTLEKVLPSSKIPPLPILNTNKLSKGNHSQCTAKLENAARLTSEHEHFSKIWVYSSMHCMRMWVIHAVKGAVITNEHPMTNQLSMQQTIQNCTNHILHSYYFFLFLFLLLLVPGVLQHLKFFQMSQHPREHSKASVDFRQSHKWHVKKCIPPEQR